MVRLQEINLTIDFISKGMVHSYKLGKTISVSRTIETTKQSNAFFLPEYSTETFRYKDVFIGNVLEGGSCNVDILNFCPHNLTHIESSAHILDQSQSQGNIRDIPENHLQGLLYLIDLTNKLSVNDKFITQDILKSELDKINFPVSAIAIKTPSSNLPQDTDFSGKDFIALDEGAAQELVDFSFEQQKITTLLLDLPSADSENDQGKLLAHRTFFEIPKEGFSFNDLKKKAIIELAYFKDVVQNYYYFITTPAKVKANAFITDILFYPLITP